MSDQGSGKPPATGPKPPPAPGAPRPAAAPQAAPPRALPVPKIAPVVPPVARTTPSPLKPPAARAPAAGSAPPGVPPARPPPAVAPARPSPAARPPPIPLQARAPAAPPVPPPGAGADAGLSPEEIKDLMERTARLAELDYYEVLKLERAATAQEIKRAFYRESRSYHPDRFFQLSNPVLKERVHELYKRVTEAYAVLRDDVKRKKYTQDISGPDRAANLRFTEQSESETKQAAKREKEEQIGSHPKGRQFYQAGVADLDAQRWAQAERNFKMALTYEPQNARYKERLAEAEKKLTELAREKGDSFKIK